MAHPRFVTGSVVATLLCAGICARGQTVGTVKSFVIDPNRPYVYLKLDHTGKGVPRGEDEPTSRIWFRLINNCRVPIVVMTFGVPDSSPKDEVGVMDEVVPDLTAVTSGGVGGPEQRPPSTEDQARKMPAGYMFDVGSSVSIPPGKAILFSVPVNHLGKRWHFEIPFSFDLPRGKGPRDPAVGGEPHMAITYSLWDLPPRYQSAVEQK